MGFSSLTLLFGVFHWTSAIVCPSEFCLLEINGKVLNHVTLRMNTSDIKITGLNSLIITKNAFDSVTHIKSLDLSNISIRHLAPRVFSKLTNLEELSLADNDLRVWQMFRIFDGLNNLKRVDLSGNSMNYLNSEFFIGVPNSAEVIIERTDFEFFGVQEGLPEKKDYGEFKTFHKTLDIEVQLCETNGTVESLSELKENETLADNCTEVFRVPDDALIDLRGLGLKKFNRNWYQLAAYDVAGIDLSHNLLDDITPELLNDIMVPLKIILVNNNISIIKKNIIENEHCMNLTFAEKSTIEIEDGAFQKLCLFELVISVSPLKNLNFIKTLPTMITRLELSGSEISEIPSDLFKNFEKLETLDFTASKIKKIRKNAFSGFGNQSSIMLAFNEIELIEEGSFSHVNLNHLSLFNNKITDGSICKGVFDGSVINYLYLGDNPMTTFDKELFSGLSEMYKISFAPNQIKRMKNLNNRKEISH